ncbi:MAG: hypothetical protein WC356_07005 [Candidatus Micrarchaeia archaeon]|jgi:hypothetical protein
MGFNLAPIKKQEDQLFPSYLDISKKGMDSQHKKFQSKIIYFDSNSYKQAVTLLKYFLNQNDFFSDVHKDKKQEKIEAVICSIATAIYSFKTKNTSVFLSDKEIINIIHNSLMEVSKDGQDLRYEKLSKFYLRISYSNPKDKMLNEFLMKTVKWDVFNYKFLNLKEELNDTEKINFNIQELNEEFSKREMIPVDYLYNELYLEEIELLEFYLKLLTIKDMSLGNKEYHIKDLVSLGISSDSGFLIEIGIINNADINTMCILYELLKNDSLVQSTEKELFLNLNSIYGDSFTNFTHIDIYSTQIINKIKKLKFNDIFDGYKLLDFIKDTNEIVLNNISTPISMSNSFDFILTQFKNVLPEEAVNLIYGVFGSNAFRWEQIKAGLPEKGMELILSQGFSPKKEVKWNKKNTDLFFSFIKRSHDFLRSMQIYSTSERYEEFFTTTLAFFMIEESLHSLKNTKIDYFRDESNGLSPNQLILTTILGMQQNKELPVSDLLGLYYYNRKSLDQNSEDNSHDLLIAFYGKLAQILKIDLGKYSSVKGIAGYNDCYDALVKLEIFWWYGFQIKNKEEMQAVFNYISASQWKTDKEKEFRLGGKNKDLFLGVLERTMENIHLKQEKGNVNIQEIKLFSLYGIVKSNDNFSKMQSEFLNKSPRLDPNKIPLKLLDRFNLSDKQELFTISQTGFYIGKEFFNVRSSPSYSNMLVWFRYVSGDGQLPLHFVSGNKLKKVKSSIGVSKFDPLGDFNVGSFIEEKVSHLGTGRSHNLFLAYDPQGKLTTVEFSSGNTLNSLEVDITKKGLYINKYLIQQRNMGARDSPKFKGYNTTTNVSFNDLDI